MAISGDGFNPKVSIIIPTYTRSDKLRECLASVVKYTAMDQTECIVVANGASDETRSICEVYREFPVTLLWFPEPLGYPKAVNRGIEASTGEYVVLLNDDAVLLEQPHNQWIDTLLKPMKADPLVGLTGPLEEYDGNSGHKFLIFFCVMIQREVFGSIGLLDEAFSPYFGEDTDFCIRAEQVGWKVVRVPEDCPTTLGDIDPNTTTLEPWKHDKMHIGNFGIFHDAESTIGHLPESEEVLRRNRKLLQDRYSRQKVNIERAVSIDGWFALDEMEWLGQQVKALPKGAIVIEVGSWKGRSSAAIADNLPEGAKLYCVDTFNGSSGEPDAHLTAKEREGDNVYMAFFHNLHDHIDRGTVIPVRMTSAHAAETMNNLRADLIFIDGDHSKEGIATDVEAWEPLVKEGGLLCGHDYYRAGESADWIYVREYVQAKYPNVQKAATSIWYVRPHEPQPRGHVYDCFLFHNELDVLEIRLATLDAVVDRFVLAEGTITHSGEPKPLHFDENKERFAKYLHKITHIVVDDWPQTEGTIYDKAWRREEHQRDAVMHGLKDCAPNDIVIIGDADEIASPEAVAGYDVSQGIVRLKQRMFYYYLNCENKEGWDWQKIAPYSEVKRLTPCGIRYPPSQAPLIENGGFHFSFAGSVEHISQKLSDYSHREYDVPEINNPRAIKWAMENAEDIFGRNLKYEFVEVDENYPAYVTDHYHELIDKGLIRVEQPEPTATILDFKPVNKLPDKDSKWSVTAEVSTKDRYTTTLPLTLAAIINQTRSPQKLKIYDDGTNRVPAEQFAEMSPFKGLLQMANDKHIEWEVLHTPRLGQVTNHQHALDNATTDFIWRVDDDEIPESNCLQVLLDTAQETGAGAVGGLVHNPGAISPLPRGIDGSLNDIGMGLNLSWFSWNSGPKECEHLYSTFLYRVDAAKDVGGYPLDLSPVGHREESWFTNKLHRGGYKVICTPHTVTHHLREGTGGIRSYADQSLWEHDEALWQTYLRACNINLTGSKLAILDCGLGDTLLFKACFNELNRRNPRKWVLAVCYPSVFEGMDDVSLISIADAKVLVGHKLDDYLLYAWMWKNNWTGSVVDAMMEYYA